jgi:hypothetical protein
MSSILRILPSRMFSGQVAVGEQSSTGPAKVGNNSGGIKRKESSDLSVENAHGDEITILNPGELSFDEGAFSSTRMTL